ncbi:hypothetical protein [Lysinibacillus sp. BPa_S21]|uniref:hypothetical protein n=1 Tax=Lysinibacillus sp. BPa_S21 TaxID=2932478 RepID=UPI0020124C73|nr:hypothetical protein [Lysinibacillus sp. BPa_S21]MCL1698319.1 hypothetical protein [Lysinibacillus sp. BPa_S21]
MDSITKFNVWKVSGKQAEVWSPMACRLVSKNTISNYMTGYRIGQILYLHHIKGMSAPEIKKVAGFGLNTNMIKSILRGFGKDAGIEAVEAYQIAMYMIEQEPEELEKLYQIQISRNVGS